MAWATGAIVNHIQPDPGNDGIWFMGYKVTNPTAGVWHYEYAVYNENLDRSIQSFSVPLGAGANISNIDFHAPPQEPGWANDGTVNNQGYSSAPWAVTQAAASITWNCETFAQNQNANAIRFGTLYNFRFDADQPPQMPMRRSASSRQARRSWLQSRHLQGAVRPDSDCTATRLLQLQRLLRYSYSCHAHHRPYGNSSNRTLRAYPDTKAGPSARPRPTPPPSPVGPGGGV